jgi:hypothetical protein
LGDYDLDDSLESGEVKNEAEDLEDDEEEEEIDDDENEEFL